MKSQSYKVITFCQTADNIPVPTKIQMERNNKQNLASKESISKTGCQTHTERSFLVQQPITYQL